MKFIFKGGFKEREKKTTTDKMSLNKNLKKYRLIYFDVRGRGEIPRLLFHAVGVNFEDTRVDPGDEWQNTFKNRESFLR